jgi:hypothetical protein
MEVCLSGNSSIKHRPGGLLCSLIKTERKKATFIALKVTRTLRAKIQVRREKQKSELGNLRLFAAQSV